MTLISTYKHNKLARAYNKYHKPKDPVLVGIAGGAATGAAYGLLFHTSSSHETAMRATGGALGGAAAGALAGKSKSSFDKKLQQLHRTHKGRKMEKLPYF